MAFKPANIFFAMVVCLLGVDSFAASMECQYQIMGAPFFHVSIALNSVGKLGDDAHVDLNGAAKNVKIAIETPKAGETMRLLLAPDNPSDQLILVLKKKLSLFPFNLSEMSGRWDSVLINPGLSSMNEASGTCDWP